MIFAGAFLVAMMIAACAVAVLKIDLTPAVAPKEVVRTRNFGEGLRISRHGIYGVDLVSIGKAHMRKLRKGPFTIGAINELVLEDVSLALTEELWREKPEAEGKGQEQGQEMESGPKAMLTKLGVNAHNLKLGDKIPRFSALSIRSLRVSRLDGTNAVPWFAAAHAEANRGGLDLTDGWSVEDGVSNAWKHAMLVAEPRLKLRTFLFSRTSARQK